jgi:myo-inositol-1(or 4)-monophosphatase
MTEALQFTKNLACETGEILGRYFRKPSVQSKKKEDRTLLTEADLAADAHISAAIRAAFPEDHILSEEHDTSYPPDGRPTWVIDPLDGTTNFNQGVFYWGVSIARVVDGWPRTAALYFPLLDELYAAQSGQGATLNSAALRVPDRDPNGVAFFTVDSRIHRKYRTEIRIKPRILGSAAYNLCAVARGMSLIGFESVPKIWDIAASWLVLTEAGGSCIALKDNLFPLLPGLDYKGFPIPLLGAASQSLAEEARAKVHLHD